MTLDGIRNSCDGLIISPSLTQLFNTFVTKKTVYTILYCTTYICSSVCCVSVCYYVILEVKQLFKIPAYLGALGVQNRPFLFKWQKYNIFFGTFQVSFLDFYFTQSCHHRVIGIGIANIWKPLSLSFYQMNLTTWPLTNDQSSSGSSRRRLAGSSGSEKQDLCSFLPCSREKLWDKRKYLLSGNKQTSDIWFCQVANIYYFVLIFIFICYHDSRHAKMI